MSHKILITGATGTVGKTLIKSLQKRNAAFKAGVRDIHAALQKLGSDVELTEFDFAQPSTFSSATENVDRVFLLGPPLRTDVDDLLYPFIDHLKQAGISRVVYLAAMGLDKVKELPFHTNVINRLKQLNFDLTVLEPTFFAQNFKNFEWQNITERGILYAPAENGRAAFVDVHDIAESAAVVLTETGHSGKTYALTGPQTFSYNEAAQLLTEILGKKIEYVAPTPQQYTETLRQSGAPEFIAPYMIGVYTLISKGFSDRVSGDVQKLTGKEPTSLKKVLQKDFAGQLA